MPDEPQNGLETAEDAVAEAEPEEIKQTAPVFPWELALRQCVRFYQKLPGGGMELKFAPAVRRPDGQAQPLPPGFSIVFDAAGWRTFQREVAGDGDPGPVVQTASVIPTGPHVPQLRPV